MHVMMPTSIGLTSEGQQSIDVIALTETDAQSEVAGLRVELRTSA